MTLVSCGARRTFGVGALVAVVWTRPRCLSATVDAGVRGEEGGAAAVQGRAYCLPEKKENLSLVITDHKYKRQYLIIKDDGLMIYKITLNSQEQLTYHKYWDQTQLYLTILTSFSGGGDVGSTAAWEREPLSCHQTLTSQLRTLWEGQRKTQGQFTEKSLALSASGLMTIIIILTLMTVSACRREIKLWFH